MFKIDFFKNNFTTGDSLLTDTSIKRTPRVGPCLSVLLFCV